MWTCLLINMWFCCCCCFWNQKSFHKKSCKEKGMVQKCVLSGHASSVICSIKTSNFGSHSYLPVSHVDSFITVAETRVSQFCFKTLHGSGWIVCPTCFFDSAFLGMVKPTIDSVILGMPAWIKKDPSAGRKVMYRWAGDGEFHGVTCRCGVDMKNRLGETTGKNGDQTWGQAWTNKTSGDLKCDT